MNRRNASMTLFVSALALLVFAPQASADKVLSEPGNGPGQTLNPSGLATNMEAGNGRLYVADTGNDRVEIFDKDGTFIKSFPTGDAPRSIAVDNSGGASNGDVYVVDNGDARIAKFGPEGEFKLAFGSSGAGEGQLNNTVGPVLVGVGPGGVVDVIDSLQAGSEFEHRLQRFEPNGTIIAPQRILGKYLLRVKSLAVNSTGDLYVSSGGKTIQKYDEDGDLVAGIEDFFEEGSNVGAQGVAVDDGGHIFVPSSESGAIVSVMELDAAGNRVRRFGYGSVFYIVNAVAPDPSGTGVYVSEAFKTATEGSRVLRIDFPPPGPVIFPQPCGASPLHPSKATLNAQINPEGKATTFHFEYINVADYTANGNSFSGPKPASKTAEEALSGGEEKPFTLHKASAQADVTPETEYRCRVVAKNLDGETTGNEGAFTPPSAPEIKAIWTAGVKAESAILTASVDPLGVNGTTGFFEYLDDATFKANGGEFTGAIKVPVGAPLQFGGGEETVIRAAAISGLTPGTTYHYRLVATDQLISPNVQTSAPSTFRTYAPGQGGLPDGRAYELVSPAQKNSAEVAVPGAAGGLFNKEIAGRIQAAAGSGEAITYTSWTSFGDAEGAPNVSQYLSKRGAGGWGTENISPFGFSKQPLIPPYRGFTPELGFGAFVIDEPSLTPEAQEGSENLYLRDNETGALQALTIGELQLVGPTGFCAGYAGASADGKHAIFAGRGALAGTGAIPGEGFSLYEWSATKGLTLVSVLPDGSAAPPVTSGLEVGLGTGFGGVGGNCTANQGPIRHAISEDGSVVFWSYGGTYAGSKAPLFARIGGAKTVQVDAKSKTNPGFGPAGEGKFRAATGDGTKVFFTAPGRLVTGTKENSLYRYDIPSGELISLTPQADPEIQGVIGASEDGKYAYFVGQGVLSANENEAGQKASQGANNLYRWHEGEGVRFIARLDGTDSGDWDSAPERLSARVTPDGRHLAFLSVESQELSSFFNTIAPPGEHCQSSFENKLVGSPLCAQAYLYDADADSLTCASCNPAGSRPAGPTELPTWSNPYEGPRYLSDDGSRLSFETRDALSSADENNRRDVYEFEVQGAGSCDAASPDFLADRGGCLSLISTGKSSDDSYLLDASGSARDVFFATRSVLTGWDTNENYDVYDARVGGGFREPASAIPCEGEACRVPPRAVLVPPTVLTPSFAGPANPKPKKHKGKKHKAQKKKHKGKKHNGKGKKHKRAAANGRAGR